MADKRLGSIFPARVLQKKMLEFSGNPAYVKNPVGVLGPLQVHCRNCEAGAQDKIVGGRIAMHEHLAKVTPAGLLEELTAREAFGRAAEPFEVANVIVFLASDYASYLTGEVIAVSSQHP